jgi:tRNA 2-(methylsulfanyl)-N6-isopentenyladenosine37 hydroxylase
MLGLQCSSSEEWIRAVNDDPAAVLIDHAHCEKKAATMAISILNRYPEKQELVEAMAELASEEMEHLSLVLFKLRERGIPFRHDPGDSYVQALHNNIRKQEPGRLLDTLIVSSLVEARSCERFQLLSESVDDPDLSKFYRSLLESEAQHRTLFLKLARMYFARETVDKRLAELSAIEASIIQGLAHAPTMHG